MSKSVDETVFDFFGFELIKGERGLHADNVTVLAEAEETMTEA